MISAIVNIINTGSTNLCALIREIKKKLHLLCTMIY